jgi:hypothetical protein
MYAEFRIIPAARGAPIRRRRSGTVIGGLALRLVRWGIGA